MKISENGLNLIKSFEGCRLKAYKCPAGVWTIGYGHTQGVKSGDIISAETAHLYLLDDISNAEKSVNKVNDYYDFNQNQFDALVSFTFNCGHVNLTKLTANNTRTLSQIADAILLYNKANGKVLSGLVRRRKAERELFVSGATKSDSLYPKYIGKSMLIDDVMRDVGALDDYDKSVPVQWQKRIPIAIANGIKDYKGTMVQNLDIISKAKKGELKKP